MQLSGRQVSTGLRNGGERKNRRVRNSRGWQGKKKRWKGKIERIMLFGWQTRKIGSM